MKRKKKSGFSKFVTLCGILALLAAIAYGIYYFFVAEDEEEDVLEGDFFGENEEPQPIDEESAPEAEGASA